MAWVKRWVIQKYWEDQFEDMPNKICDSKAPNKVKPFSNGSELFNNFTIPWLNALYQFNKLYSGNEYENKFFVESFSKIRNNFNAWNDEYKRVSWDVKNFGE